jgi:PrtD family type I secretion system ABC transporter
MSLFRPLWPKPILDAVSRCKSHFRNAAFFSACIGVLYLAPTLYMMQVYDRVVPTAGTLTLFWLTVIVGLAVGTLTMLDNIRTRLLTRSALQLDQQLSGEILDRLLAAAPKGIQEPGHAQALREFDVIRQTMSSPVATALMDLPWTPIFVIVAFIIHPILGLLIIGGGAVLIALALINERAARERSKQAHKSNSDSYASQAELASKSEVIRVLGMRRAMVKLQQISRSEGLGETLRMQIAGSYYSTWVKFVRMFLQSLSLGVGAWLAITGQISVGTIIAASVLLGRALQPIEQVVGGWSQINQARNSFQSMKKMFEETEGDVQKPMLLPEPVGKVEAINLTLRNPAENAFLVRGVNFKFEPGQITGLIGHSGAGKSTVARIMSGAIMPEVGEVRIDGATFADWDREQLAKHIGYLPQDYAMLPGTIAENISRFDVINGESAEEVGQKIIAAARLAGIHDLILKMPEGYSTRLCTPEFAPSGGQTQRIALARALYGLPKILILDEPSSAQDGEGEQILLRAMEVSKNAGCAVLVVAHRPYVLQNADQLVVMAGGTVERQGPRDEVLSMLREAAQQKQNVVNLNRR